MCRRAAAANVSTIGQRDDIHQFTARIDHSISESDMIYGRYTYNKRDSLVPGYLGSVLFPGFGEYQNFPAHNVGIHAKCICSGHEPLMNCWLGSIAFSKSAFTSTKATM